MYSEKLFIYNYYSITIIIPVLISVQYGKQSKA